MGKDQNVYSLFQSKINRWSEKIAFVACMVCSGVCIGNKDLIIDIPPSHIGMEMSKKKKKP